MFYKNFSTAKKLSYKILSSVLILSVLILSPHSKAKNVSIRYGTQFLALKNYYGSAQTEESVFSDQSAFTQLAYDNFINKNWSYSLALDYQINQFSNENSFTLNNYLNQSSFNYSFGVHLAISKNWILWSSTSSDQQFILIRNSSNQYTIQKINSLNTSLGLGLKFKIFYFDAQIGSQIKSNSPQSKTYSDALELSYLAELKWIKQKWAVGLSTTYTQISFEDPYSNYYNQKLCYLFLLEKTF